MLYLPRGEWSLYRNFPAIGNWLFWHVQLVLAKFVFSHCMLPAFSCRRKFRFSRHRKSVFSRHRNSTFSRHRKSGFSHCTRLNCPSATLTHFCLTYLFFSGKWILCISGIESLYLVAGHILFAHHTNLVFSCHRYLIAHFPVEVPFTCLLCLVHHSDYVILLSLFCVGCVQWLPNLTLFT